MIADAYQVYRYYLALKLHFTTDHYDVIKQSGRVKTNKQAFYKRKDLFALKKVAQTYSDEEVVNFLVANFVSGDRWGGVFDVESKQRYLQWKKRLESISYIFEQELNRLYHEAQKLGVDKLAMLTKHDHPLILKMYLRHSLSIETLVILNNIINFLPSLDESLKEDIIWPDVSRIIKKYTPFLIYNQDKIHGIYRKFEL